jgi:cardiolipin synthase
LGQIPLWVTGTIIGRDVLLGLGGIIVRMMVGKITIRPRISGKVATVFQMVTVFWILLRWDFMYPAFWLRIWVLGAGILTGISGLFYVWDGTRQLSAHPSSSPITK